MIQGFPLRSAVLGTSLALAALTYTGAGRADEPAIAPRPGWVAPPGNLRADRGAGSFSLDTLFAALKIAPDTESAKAIEQRIWAKWMVSGSDTCDLLMERARVAAEHKNYRLSIKLLDAVIALKPDYVEAWNRQATVYYLMGDYARALVDIREVLAREPRHFAALAGLGMILQDLGDDKHALEAYRKALAIDPHLEHVPEAVRSLSAKVEGRNI